MTSNLESLSRQKIDDDLQFIMRCFREVLCSLGEEALADKLPWIDGQRDSVELAVEDEGKYSRR